MSRDSSCPSDWALERYVLEELPPDSSNLVQHVSACQTCRARVAAQRADGAAFLSSSGAEEIRRKLAFAQRGQPRRWLFALIAAVLGLALVIALPYGVKQHAGSGLPTNDAEELAVLRFQDEWLQAVCRKDVNALDRILSDDYTYTDASGRVSGKADDLRRARTEQDGMLSFKTSNVNARIYGDVAVVTGQLWMRGASRGKTYDAEVVFTDTLARIDGQWRAVAAHVSKPPASSPGR